MGHVTDSNQKELDVFRLLREVTKVAFSQRRQQTAACKNERERERGLLGQETNQGRPSGAADELNSADEGRGGPSSISPGDVLCSLRSRGAPHAMTPGRLSEAMLVSSAGLSGRLRRLETEGWIERRTSPDDGRSIIVQLTPAGSADLDGFLAEQYRFEDSLLDSLSSDNRAILAAKLRDLVLSL